MDVFLPLVNYITLAGGHTFGEVAPAPKRRHCGGSVAFAAGILPDQLRRDVMSSRHVTTVCILFKLFVVFQAVAPLVAAS